MQTPKTRIGTGSSEVPKRAPPATPQTAWQQKTPGIDPDSGPSSATRSPKDKSTKIIDRRSRHSPASEQKKRPGKISDLESQLAKLQEELKEAKDQLTSSESWKKRTQQNNEEAKKQLAAMAAKLEESQQQILELSSSEDARVQELRKISQDRDRAWESELEAVQKHHSMDSAALVSAMNEIQKVKMQLEQVAESEAALVRHADSAYAEVQRLRLELTETLSLVENLKNQIHGCTESEAQALEVVSKSKIQLAMAKSTKETLTSEGLKAMEASKSMAMELEQSKNQVILLEGLVSKLQANIVDDSNKNAADPSGDIKIAPESGEHEELNLVKTELDHVKYEVVQLRFALEAAERRYQEEYTQSTLQIRSAYELVERTKSEYYRHEAELEENLKVAKADVEELKSKLMDKETKFHQGFNLKVMEIQSAVRESDLEIELKKFKEVSVELMASLLEKEKELQSITEENETLKLEMKEREIEKNKMNDEMLALANVARAAEREALMKVGHLTEEADKSTRKAVRVTEQLDAAQAANSELEVELRRLKVQADQWRKAAEAATAMLLTGNNGKIVERTGSLDDNYHTIGGKLGSTYSKDMDDDLPKKKNGNMLKKIGVLLKKGHK